MSSRGEVSTVANTGEIYDQVIEIMATSSEAILTKTFFYYELAPYPPALFDKNGDARSTSKSALNSRSKVEVVNKMHRCQMLYQA